MKRHGWSLRSKITALLVLPLFSLSALWTYAAYLSLENALTLVRVDTIGNHLAHPLGQVFISLQTERRTSLVALASAPADEAGRDRQPQAAVEEIALARSRALTDDAVAEFTEHAAVEKVRDSENDEVERAVARARELLDGLAALRRGVDGHTVEPQQVLERYTAVNSAISAAFDAMTLLPDEDAQRFGQSLYTQTLAGDYQAQEDALISAAAVTGRMTPESYSLLVQAIGANRRLMELALAGMPEKERAAYERYAAPDGPLAKVMEMEEQLLRGGPDAGKLPFPISRWRAAYDAQWKGTNKVALDDIDVVFTMTGPPARRALWALGLAGALGLLALVVSLVMAVRIGRSLVRDVSRLRESARNLTETELRDVVGRLRRGEKVDVKADMTRPHFAHRELSDLGDAFFALQTTAVELADEDVRLHQRVSEVFVNLARRSQTLVHQQLGLLDAMERREDAPDRLAELYRLDQIAMHLRRYAESLIIVSGASTGRVWRTAVPAVDVVRGAVAETADYARVTVLPVPAIGVVGRAVADIVHLLAELIENAQHFSPSDTQVRVGVSSGATGLVVEIDDRGLGMSAEHLAEANARIREQVDLSDLDSTRLGLITVGRLARRHDVTVELRHSPYGGVTAVVLLPHKLLEELWPETGRESAPQRAEESGPNHPVRHPAQPVPGPQNGATRGALPGAPPHARPSVTATAVLSDQAPAGHPPAEPDLTDGLPRRVRQASLAPQLQPSAPPATGALFDRMTPAARSIQRLSAPPPTPAASSAPGHPPGPEADARPAQVRSLMSALQAGSAHGRHARGDHPQDGRQLPVPHPRSAEGNPR